MDSSFGTTPPAMTRAVKLMEKWPVDPELVITHRCLLGRIDEATKVMAANERTKMTINP